MSKFDDMMKELSMDGHLPEQDYGKVIYLIAAAFFIFGLFRLIFNVFGDNEWATAYDSKKSRYNKKSLKTLLYVKERYDIIKKTNLKSYKKRKKDLHFCFYYITVSAIILIVIKTLK